MDLEKTTHRREETDRDISSQRKGVQHDARLHSQMEKQRKSLRL